MSFNNLGLIDPITDALRATGYTRPTEIQSKAIPVVLTGKDLLACAQTGTGKTAAFVLPILQLMQSTPQRRQAGFRPVTALVLAPTRELAIQIGENITAYSRFLDLKHHVIFGGVPQFSQVKALKSGVDILVATPGRLLDLLQQRHLSLAHLRFFVLDEADRMLDCGFIHDIRKIIAQLPAQRQNLLFSATMPPPIKQLANTLLTAPASVAVHPESSTVDRIDQSVYYVNKSDKKNLLIDLLQDESIESVLVFTQMKHAADKLSKLLQRAGISSQAIHGNKSQSQRQQALKSFKNRTTRVLVATDIAARGIDVDELSHVINYELPDVPETYVHRIGRTGRAGASGIAISLCDQEEGVNLRDIQKLIGQSIPVVSGHKYEAAYHQEPIGTQGHAANFRPRTTRFPGRDQQTPRQKKSPRRFFNA